MDLKQIRELIAELEKSQLKKIVYKKGNEEIYLEKEESHPPPPHHHAPAVHHHVAKGGHEASSLPPAAGSQKESGKFVSSPMVGTFYGSPSPDDPPFVKVGDKVSADTILCIIEAMKVMNEVKAGVSGTVAEVLTENAEPVEFGTKLFRIV